MQNNLRTGSETVRLRARRFNTLMGILLVLVAFQAFVAIKVFTEGRGVSPGLPLMLVVTAFFYACFAGAWIDLSPSEIAITKFFWSRRSISRSEITGWAIKSGWKAGDRMKNVPYRRLEIYTEKGSPPFMVGINPFSKEDIQKLTEFLPRNHNARE
jgi:hypothetical protein